MTWGIVAIGVILGNHAYYRHVLPALRRCGYKPDYPLFMPSGQLRQFQEYRRICVAEGRSLRLYRACFAIHVTAWVLFVVLVAALAWLVVSKNL
ncbi:MAG: hypothetical protein HZC42_10415 [Candidatus Eisenbacteria bacterium]|nr:hypothetical protein [Candidatus Eisenbacteria bacterium]